MTPNEWSDAGPVSSGPEFQKVYKAFEKIPLPQPTRREGFLDTLISYGLMCRSVGECQPRHSPDDLVRDAKAIASRRDSVMRQYDHDVTHASKAQLECLGNPVPVPHAMSLKDYDTVNVRFRSVKEARDFYHILEQWMSLGNKR